MSVNLAELYQAANIPVSAEDFALRTTAFDAAIDDLSDKQLIDCCRIYYGLWAKIDDFEWFLTAFKNDPRFSLNGNRRESSVLAGGLLLSELKAGNAFAGLAAIAASVQGTRNPAVAGIDLSTFEKELRNLAVEQTSPRSYDTKYKALAKTTITKEKIAQDNTALTMASVVMTGFNEGHLASKEAFEALQVSIKTMAADLSSTREQLSILWWLTGGWSRTLRRAFAHIGSPLGFATAGFDLADLSHSVHGPYASEALLARVLSVVKKPRKSITIGEVGDSQEEGDLSLLNLSGDATQYADICPISAALLKSSEIGKGDAWHAAFEKSAHLSTKIELSPQQLAVQAMYERLLLNNL